jgi:hypothetical protein
MSGCRTLIHLFSPRVFKLSLLDRVGVWSTRTLTEGGHTRTLECRERSPVISSWQRNTRPKRPPGTSNPGVSPEHATPSSVYIWGDADTYFYPNGVLGYTGFNDRIVNRSPRSPVDPTPETSRYSVPGALCDPLGDRL